MHIVFAHLCIQFSVHVGAAYVRESDVQVTQYGGPTTCSRRTKRGDTLSYVIHPRCGIWYSEQADPKITVMVMMIPTGLWSDTQSNVNPTTFSACTTPVRLMNRVKRVWKGKNSTAAATTHLNSNSVRQSTVLIFAVSCFCCVSQLNSFSCCWTGGGQMITGWNTGLRNLCRGQYQLLWYRTVSEHPDYFLKEQKSGS